MRIKQTGALDPRTVGLPRSLWLYHDQAALCLFSADPQQGESTELQARGYQQHHATDMGELGLSILEGQLAEMVTVGDTVWVSDEMVRHAERVPTLLAFRPTAHQAQGFRATPALPEFRKHVIVHELPPPTLGEVALIWDGATWVTLDATALDQPGRDLRNALQQLIMTMAGPATAWVPFTPLLLQWAYEDETVPVQTRFPADAEEAEALRCIADVRHWLAQRQPERYAEQWVQLRGLARQLADAYWQAFTVQQVPKAITHPLAPTVTIPYGQVTGSIMRALLNREEYRQAPPQATWTDGHMTIVVAPGDGETWEVVLDSLGSLGDEAVDTFCALLAIAIDTHTTAHITQPFMLNPDDLLHVCQRKKSNGAYTPEQRANTVEILRLLARAHIRMSMPVKRRKRVRRIDSPLVDLLGTTLGEYEVDGTMVWQAREVKIGTWAQVAPQLLEQTGAMLRQVLQYHPQRERYAKRLGRYLTLQFHAQGVMRSSMSTILQQAGIIPDTKNPGRTRTMIEHALTTLKTDGVLGDYQLIITSDQTQQRIDEHARNWWDLYVDQEWAFFPPQLRLPEHTAS